MVLKLEHALESSRGLIKTQFLSLSPRAVDSVRLGWDLRICISNKFPGDAAVADPVSTLPEPLAWNPVKQCDVVEREHRAF